jgi:AraC-like DNA-binding protein
MTSLEELRALVLRHKTGPVSTTSIPGVRLYHTNSAAPVTAQVTYAPMLCIMLQGEKRVMLGADVLRYTPEDYLLSCVHLPVTGTVVNVYPDEPYLAISLALDMDVIADLLIAAPAPSLDRPAEKALCIGKLSASLLDCFLRLARLLDEPALIAQVSPLITREIVVRLLCSGDASMLRQIATQSSYVAGIARAIQLLREGYAKAFSATALARTAGMSLGSFNRHFRTITGMSALQYQKQTRLQEARRLLFLRQGDAASVGFSVGYASASQFSREYARSFGRPPQEDASWLRSQSDIYQSFFS